MPTALRVNPTRMEMTRIKKRLVTATRGHKLLKDKRDEMVRQFILLIRENYTLRREVEAELSGALRDFAMARAVMSPQSLEAAVLYPARQAELHVSERNILSVHVPTIEADQASLETTVQSYGLRKRLPSWTARLRRWRLSCRSWYAWRRLKRPATCWRTRLKRPAAASTPSNM